MHFIIQINVVYYPTFPTFFKILQSLCNNKFIHEHYKSYFFLTYFVVYYGEGYDGGIALMGDVCRFIWLGIKMKIAVFTFF